MNIEMLDHIKNVEQLEETQHLAFIAYKNAVRGGKSFTGETTEQLKWKWLAAVDNYMEAIAHPKSNAKVIGDVVVVSPITIEEFINQLGITNLACDRLTAKLN